MMCFDIRSTVVQAAVSRCRRQSKRWFMASRGVLSQTQPFIQLSIPFYSILVIPTYTYILCLCHADLLNSFYPQHNTIHVYLYIAFRRKNAVCTEFIIFELLIFSDSLFLICFQWYNLLKYNNFFIYCFCASEGNIVVLFSRPGHYKLTALVFQTQYTTVLCH